MRVTATKLRADLYNILDSVVLSGTPVEIVRGDSVLRIVAEKKLPKLARLKRHECLNCAPEELIHRDWIK